MIKRNLRGKIMHNMQSSSNQVVARNKYSREQNSYNGIFIKYKVQIISHVIHSWFHHWYVSSFFSRNLFREVLRFFKKYKVI